MDYSSKNSKFYVDDVWINHGWRRHPDLPDQAVTREERNIPIDQAGGAGQLALQLGVGQKFAEETCPERKMDGTMGESQRFLMVFVDP